MFVVVFLLTLATYADVVVVEEMQMQIDELSRQLRELQGQASRMQADIDSQEAPSFVHLDSGG